jgi:hypothetical protein
MLDATRERRAKGLRIPRTTSKFDLKRRCLGRRAFGSATQVEAG